MGIKTDNLEATENTKTVTTEFTPYDLGTISGTTNVDWANGDIQIGLMSADVTFTFSNPKSTTMVLRIAHAASGVAYDITVPSSYNADEAGLSAKVYDLGSGATSRSIFNILHDGTNYHLGRTAFEA